MQIKKIFSVLAIALTCITTTSAQYVTEYDDAPYWYVGLKGGIQTVPTNYSLGSLIAPAIGIDFGRQFFPEFGIRGDIQGLWSKTAFKGADATDGFKYVTGDLDLLFNLTNIFASRPQDFTISLVTGVGLNYSWDTEDAANYPSNDRIIYSHEYLWSHNIRLGALADYKINRHWAVNLEVDANNLQEEFNSKWNAATDWQITAMLGLQYRWGHPSRSVTRSELISSTEYCDVCGLSLARCPYHGKHPNTNAQTEPLPAVVYNTAEEVHIEVFFDLDNAEIRPSEDAKLRGLSNFVRDHEIGTVLVKGYADRQTGNPPYNQKLSERRAQTIVDALTGTYGIPVSRIESQAFGDKVQPFAENDLNRVVIIDIKEAAK